MLVLRFISPLFLLLFIGNYPLQAQVIQTELHGHILKVRFPSQIDSNSLPYHLTQLRTQYLANAYFEYKVDSINHKRGTAHIFLNPGNKFKISRVFVTTDSGKVRSTINKYRGTEPDTQFASELAAGFLKQYENTGYPFAEAELRISADTQAIQYDLILEKGPYFSFDTAHIDGDKVIRKSFLEAYTGIKAGMPYNEELFRKAHAKLNQLPYLSSVRVPLLAFIHGGIAKPYFYLKKRKSDQVNGLVGLAPNQTNTGGILLTGEFLIRLNNLFKTGKMLFLNWRSFQARSQELKGAFKYPYILGKPLGADISLQFVKFDTLYSTFTYKTGLQYFTSGVNGFKAYYHTSSTNLLSIDTNTIRLSEQLPVTNAMEIRMYGLQADFNLLNDRQNPTKGWWILADAAVGTKTIVRDNRIAALKFGSDGRTLYDSMNLVSNQYQYFFQAKKFTAISPRSTILGGVYVSGIISDRIYFNELIREGGINSLKGFNEQSIFASQFNMLELEYRYITGPVSHIRFFWNGAYYLDKSYGRNGTITDFPWGFGVGGSFETGAGILNLVYALGKEKNNNFQLRNGKVHFGLSSYF